MKTSFSHTAVLNAINHLAISCYVLKALTNTNIFLVLAAILGLLVLGVQILSRQKVTSTFIISLLIVVMSYALTFYNNGLDSGKLTIPFFLANTGIAWRIATHGINYRYFWWLFYGSVCYFMLSYFAFAISTDDILAGSRNHISVYFINLAIMLMIASLFAGKTPGVIPALWACGISILAVGTGGILSGCALLALLIYHKFFRKLPTAKFLLLIVSSSVIYVMLTEWTSISEFIITGMELEGDAARKLEPENLFGKNERYGIWAEYFERMTLERSIFGTYILQTYHGYGNLHNSYLLLHAKMGIFSVALIAVFLFSLVRLFLLHFVLFACLFAILLRAFTDTTIMAGSLFDYVCFYLVMFAAHSVPHNLKNNGAIKNCS